MVSHSLRFWLAAFIFILAVVILVVSFWPEVRTQQIVPMPPLVLPTAAHAVLFIPGEMAWKGR